MDGQAHVTGSKAICVSSPISLTEWMPDITCRPLIQSSGTVSEPIIRDAATSEGVAEKTICLMATGSKNKI